MKVTKTMKNVNIYSTAENLLTAFPQNEEGKIPVKALFLLRKNIKTFVDLAQEIEKTRTEIIQKYGFNLPSRDGNDIADINVISEKDAPLLHNMPVWNQLFHKSDSLLKARCCGGQFCLQKIPL